MEPPLSLEKLPNKKDRLFLPQWCQTLEINASYSVIIYSPTTKFPKNVLQFLKCASPKHGRLCFNITEAICPSPAADVRKLNNSLMTFLPRSLVIWNASRFQRILSYLHIVYISEDPVYSHLAAIRQFIIIVLHHAYSHNLRA